MTHSDKVIIVFGVTGQQGGSAARALLKAGWSVAGITRNPDSGASKEVAALGVKLYQGDLDDPASYAPALEGAHGAFLTLDFFAHYNGRNAAEAEAAEAAQGIGAVQAFAAARLPHVVFSTLEVVSHGDQGVTVPHFESKAAVAERLRASNVPSTLLYTSAYYSNVVRQIREVDGALLLDMPTPDATVFPSFAVEQTGLWVAKAFEDQWIGKDMYAVGENITVADMAKRLAKVTGREVRTNKITEDQFKNDTTTDREIYANFLAFHRGLMIRDVEASRKIAPEAWDFEAWAKQNDAILKYRQ